jgi:hypothetical protein
MHAFNIVFVTHAQHLQCVGIFHFELIFVCHSPALLCSTACERMGGASSGTAAEHGFR